MTYGFWIFVCDDCEKREVVDVSDDMCWYTDPLVVPPEGWVTSNDKEICPFCLIKHKFESIQHSDD